MSKNIHSEEVSYPAAGGTCRGLLAWDADQQGPRPGVLVVHEWWGNNEYPRRRARMLAELGYIALALDMYGEGQTADDPEQAGALMNATLSDMDAGMARFAAARQLLSEHENCDASRLAAIGYCFGGAAVLSLARKGADLRAVCSFHGMLETDTPAAAGTVQAAVFVAHGDADPMVPPEDVAAFKAEMEAAGARLEFHGYPGVTHAFTNPAADQKAETYGVPLGYNQHADEDSWARMAAFLERSFA